jgi:Putative MetA-pathway of phenol degradation
LALPTYTFATPVFGGQLTVGAIGIYGRAETSLAGTVAGALATPLDTLPFSRFDSISDSVSGFGDVLPIATLRWNNGVHNYMTYITGDVPIGAYDSTRLSNIGIAESARTGLMKCSKRLTGLVVHSITSSARRSSVERISMPSFGVLQTNERAGPLFDLDQG